MKAPVKQVVAVVTKQIAIRSAENILDLIETDQADPAGRWRFRLDGDKVYLERATAAGWATYETWLTYDKANEKLILGKKLDAGALKIENLGAPDSDNDVPRRDTIDSKITTHKEKTTGVHGVEASTVDSVANRDGAIADHAGLPNVHHTKTIDASELTAGILALARLANITNAQIAAGAAIAESKLALAQDTQALFNKIVDDIATHAGLPTVHQDASALAATLIGDHAGLPAAHHAVHLKTLGDHPLSIIPTMDDAHIPAAIARDTEVTTKVTTHEEKTTGVHGVGASAVCSETELATAVAAEATLRSNADTSLSAEIDSDILTHKGDANAHHTPSNPGIWTLAEILSPASVTSIDSSVLAAHDEWMILLDLYVTFGVTGKSEITLRFNDDSGANYASRALDNTSVIMETGVSDLYLGEIDAVADERRPFIAQLLIKGKGGSDAADVLTIAALIGLTKHSALQMTNGTWICGTADITKFNFLFEHETAGKIHIYYRDY